MTYSFCHHYDLVVICIQQYVRFYTQIILDRTFVYSENLHCSA